MSKFGEAKVANKEFYRFKYIYIYINWDVDVSDIAISKLVETKNNSKYLTGYLYKIITY